MNALFRTKTQRVAFPVAVALPFKRLSKVTFVGGLRYRECAARHFVALEKNERFRPAPLTFVAGLVLCLVHGSSPQLVQKDHHGVICRHGDMFVWRRPPVHAVRCLEHVFPLSVHPLCSGCDEFLHGFLWNIYHFVCETPPFRAGRHSVDCRAILALWLACSLSLKATN